jgi:hypothetical protein
VSELKVHHLLHGYRKGHQRLAGSCKLPSHAADLVDQLSDLPGSQPPAFHFSSYLTLYPVLNTEFYAIARTWPDEDAPRSGCVITHTLLVPIAKWGAVRRPNAFATLHFRPSDKADTSIFDTPLSVEESDLRLEDNPLQTSKLADADLDFVRKLFADNIRPLVYFDCRDVEPLVWAIACLAWPALRKALTVATLCFQPRTSGGDAFELMFAPSLAKPRFHSLQREAFVPDVAASRGERKEPWIEELASALRSGTHHWPIQAELEDLADYLPDDPAIVQTLFTLRELSRRAATSPTAGVGVLDLIDAIIPGEDAGVEKKTEVVNVAIQSAKGLPPEEGLRAMHLISQRLGRASFQEVARLASPIVQHAVHRFVLLDPSSGMEVLDGACRTSGRPGEGLFIDSLLDGLEDVARADAASVAPLRSYPEAGVFSVSRRPSIALGYLLGVRSKTNDAIAPLVRWIHLANGEARVRLRRTLIRHLSEAEAPILAELLADVPFSEVYPVCDEVVESGVLASEPVRRLVADAVAGRHPEAVVAWAENGTCWATEAAEVVAAAISPSPAGLERIMQIGMIHSERGADILAAFVSAVIGSYKGAWLRDYTAGHVAHVRLLAEFATGNLRARAALAALLSDCMFVPIAHETSFIETIPRIGDEGLASLLMSHGMQSVFVDYVRGRLSWGSAKPWLDAEWFRRRLEAGVPDALYDAIRAARSSDEYKRSWELLLELLHSLFGSQSGGLPIVVRTMVNEGYGVKTPDSAGMWASVIRRAKALTSPSVHLRLCVDALSLSFRSPRLPLGPVVVASFRTVYDAVCEPLIPHEVEELFGFFHWDKAKELRKSLINAFQDSSWQPGDLLLAVGDEWLVRKIVKRLLRRYGGDRYLQAALEDLKSRNDPEVTSVFRMGSDLASDPDFYEPWD